MSEKEIVLGPAEETLHRIVCMALAQFNGDEDKTAFWIRDHTGHGKGYAYAILEKYKDQLPPPTITAAALVRKLRERCQDHLCYGEGRLVNHDNPEEAWGECESANELLKLAESLLLKPLEGK